MSVFNVVINVVLVGTTLVVIWYARETVGESRKATKAARDTVAAVEALLAVVRDTATSSQGAADAARQTVEAARAAHEADERDRKVRRLREIGELVERTFEKAAAEAQYRRPAWRCIEQRELLPLLVGMEPPLPKCHHLAGESQAAQVFAAAQNAHEEIAEH
jgi:hypothetical protein